MSGTPATLPIGGVETKPVHEEHIHPRRGLKSCLHQNVVDPDDSGVPIRERRTSIHPIGMYPRIGGLFYPLGIICCRPEPNSFMFVQSVLNYDDVIAVLMSEVVFVPTVWGPSDTHE